MDRHVAGWIATYNIAPHKRELPFTIPGFPSGIAANSTSVLLRVSYLKSYIGFGVFTVWLCGAQITDIDTLWANGGISIPAFYSYVVTPEDLHRCAKRARAVRDGHHKKGAAETGKG